MSDAGPYFRGSRTGSSVPTARQTLEAGHAVAPVSPRREVPLLQSRDPHPDSNSRFVFASRRSNRDRQCAPLPDTRFPGCDFAVAAVLFRSHGERPTAEPAVTAVSSAPDRLPLKKRGCPVLESPQVPGVRNLDLELSAAHGAACSVVRQLAPAAPGASPPPLAASLFATTHRDWLFAPSVEHEEQTPRALPELRAARATGLRRA